MVASVNIEVKASSNNSAAFAGPKTEDTVTWTVQTGHLPPMTFMPAMLIAR
jgi:hypothetical protein